MQSTYTEGLNPEQKKAVLHHDGPLLILAGAGSGKTRVLTHRIAHLVEEKGVAPWQILAITFTNKAAKEMRDRLERMVGARVHDMWVSTFHASCVRMLRSHIEKLGMGYHSNFVIFDSADQQTVVKSCVKELRLSDANFPPRGVLSVISNAKNEMLTSDRFQSLNAADYRLSKIADIYTRYQRILVQSNALDFDDILMLTVQLFEKHPDVLTSYQDKFRYILVDEYQDTNNVQYLLVSQLAKRYRNICVVGDDDQSIYKFRGADIRNILDFEKDFKDAVVIKLEENYRSTQHILEAANQVIKNNRGRKGKTLFTQKTSENKVTLLAAGDEHEEARMVAEHILWLKSTTDYAFKDFTILYRTNAQSRVFEDVFLRQAVPYRIYGGLRFYERKEIKDIMAYLRLV
ncbi:MAG: UvrD-helicase domain-containing protein, partial [Hyphomonadaceae bacterium]|nr:UvrD-helicase domain-containing protein [Clostridia bacterium]